MIPYLPNKMVSIFISYVNLKIETIFIEIVCIIHNEEQQLHRPALQDDEDKEGPKGCADPEA